MSQRVFIGSSTESLGIAEEIQYKLERYAAVTVWSDDVFKPSEYAIDSLLVQLDSSDYAIFVLSDDDFVRIRGEEYTAIRDNVIFEMGLFSGRLGLSKVLMVHPRVQNLRIPSDLLGINMLSYSLREGQTLSSSLGAVCSRIKNKIVSTHAPMVISWREYAGLVRSQIQRLKQTPSRGGYSFDACLGISRGGIIAADMIARHFGSNIPVYTLWADIHSKQPVTVFDPPANSINQYVYDAINAQSHKNVLLVNDISRSGQTCALAKRSAQKFIPNAQVKLCALIVDRSVQVPEIDYFSAQYDTKNLQMPYFELE